MLAGNFPISGSGTTPSISGRRVARELATLIERRGRPGMIVSDNGTELTSNAILTFAAQQLRS
jgi:transposase InsO family protein|tara:strand:- start:679 stop:867 length:189 start_codon:yes stop_codon:yes gene_type:complete